MPTGIATAYDLTVGVKVNMDEAIYLLSPLDTPLLTGIAGDNLSVLSTQPVDEISFSWMHDTILTPRSTLAVNAVTADTSITLASGDRTKFSTGDVIRVSKPGTSTPEILRVTGYSATTADAILVTRGYDSTTATTYATNAAVIGLGTALAEGSDPETARTVDRVEVSNNTQIYGPTKIQLSGTEQLVGKYGVKNEFTHQFMARMSENAIAREQSFLYGRKTNSTTTKIRTSGGLQYFLTTNANATLTELNVLNIQTLQQSCYDQGGLPDRLVANPASLADLNDVANTNVIRQEIVDPKRGRVRTESIWTEFGPISVIRDRWCHKSDAFLIKRENVIRRVLRPLVLERLAKTGDADLAQILCEEGLEVKGQAHMAMFNNLTDYSTV